MRKPMRTIAAAITIGIMSATAATGINYPTSIEAKAADTPSSTAPAEMSEAQIRTRGMEEPQGDGSGRRWQP